MRIGLLTDSFKPYVSGVSASIHLLAEGLIAAGHEVYIITPTYKGYKEYDVNYPYIKRIKGITLPKKGVTFLKYIPFVGRYVKNIKDLDLDVIHLHTELTIGKLALKAHKKLNIPLVYTVHTMYEEYMHFVSKFMAKHCHKTLLKIVQKTMKKFIIPAEITIVPSKKIKDLMNSYEIAGNYRIVPTGINLNSFKKENYNKDDVLKLKRSLGLKEDEFVCLYVGRISREKEIDMLIEGFKNIDNEKIKFVVVGDGPHLKEIKELVKEYKIENKVIFTGLVSWEEIGLYYQIGDLFLNASISETQGLTYIEALAAELPLLVRYDEVLEDVITNGYNGLFFNEIDEISEKINKVFNNDELRTNLAENCLKSVLKYDQKNYVNNALKAYNEAIKIKEIREKLKEE